MGDHMFPGFIHFSRVGIVDYAPESRVVPNRNVVETKADYEVVDVTAVALFLHFFTATVLGLVGYAWWCLSSHVSTQGNVQAAIAWLFGSYCRITNDIDFYVSHYLTTAFNIVPKQCHQPILTDLLFLRLFLATIACAAVLHWLFSRKVCTVSYVPHVVSSVVAEYSRGTNSVAASSTMRQRVLRLATLPLPDHVYLKLVWGSEAAASVLLDHQSFFTGGVLHVLPHR